MSGAVQAGAATSNITPWLGTVIPGLFRPRYAEDVDDELLAKALVLDNGDTRVAMVTCDLIAMPQKVADAAKFKRNTIIHNGPKFVGRWVAVPEVDFDKLQAALRSLKEGR